MSSPASPAPPALDQLPFTIHNLPYGVISTAAEPTPRCAAAIGQYAVDLAKYAQTGCLAHAERGTDASLAYIFAQCFGSADVALAGQPALNAFAALPWAARRAVRQQLQDDLRAAAVPAACLVPLADVRPHLPMQIGGFSDFYTSLDHCKNCSGELTAKHIYKNWYYAPSVYNGRASSIVPTPAQIRRPVNVAFTGALDSEPAYGPSRKLDFELEMGFFVSEPVALGERMEIAAAPRHIFGFVLLNDWSARDHQVFEMRPLGPFHSKGFGTSVSNWVVPMEALAPGFACAPTLEQVPAPFPHLTWPAAGTRQQIDGAAGVAASAHAEGGQGGALDVRLRVKLVRQGVETVLATSNLKYLYWTPYQQLAHHAASGCGMRTGDLVGTGTISGSGRDKDGKMCELGCLYESERTDTRTMPEEGVSGKYQAGYLEDGDEVIFDGWCEDDKGNVVFGFGDCRGTVAPPI